MLNSQPNRDEVIGYFPELANDQEFEVTSAENDKYNCIAWAGLVDNEWWQADPRVPFIFDGVVYNWPYNATISPSIDALIDLFSKMGYTVCADGNFENGYRKVALYADKDGNYTHAARMLRNGKWTSKLGNSFDIQHGTPQTIEGTDYGTVHTYMKRSNI